MWGPRLHSCWDASYLQPICWFYKFNLDIKELIVESRWFDIFNSAACHRNHYGWWRFPWCPAAVHTSNSLIRKTTASVRLKTRLIFFPPEAQVDDQQGSDSVIPNYFFFFFTLDPVALIISYLGLQSNLKWWQESDPWKSNKLNPISAFL